VDGFAAICGSHPPASPHTPTVRRALAVFVSAGVGAAADVRLQAVPREAASSLAEAASSKSCREYSRIEGWKCVGRSDVAGNLCRALEPGVGWRVGDAARREGRVIAGYRSRDGNRRRRVGGAKLLRRESNVAAARLKTGVGPWGADCCLLTTS
jgi:hypothetical protein